MADPALSSAIPDGATAAGLPPTAMLEEMANAFFRALPSGPTLPGSGVPGTGLSASGLPTSGPGAAASLPAGLGTGLPAEAPVKVPAGLPAISGVGLAPPSFPQPPVPASARIVPVVPLPSPFSAAPVSADPHLPSIADQHRTSSSQLYVTQFSGARPQTPSRPIPALDQSAPSLAALQAQPGHADRGYAPSHAGPSSAFPSGHAPASAPYFLTSAAPVAPLASPARPGSGRSAPTPFDPHVARRDFPILSERVNGKPLVWLDNAATTQKPKAVIDRLSYFYEHENSNIHRAAHTLAGRATDAYEAARETVRRFINAASVDEIVFVRGTTEAINLVAETFGRQNIGAGDEIVITWLEHHANIVPWFRLAESVGAKLRVAPVDDNGDVIIEEYAKLLGPRTKLVSLTQVSNALGTVTPAALMTAMAHGVGAKVLVDAAQSVSHMRSDVQALDADFFVFSGHKVFGPTGIGALYGKKALLDSMPPYQSGGNMIADVTFEKILYQPAPSLFEAGTGNIADAVGLGAALTYLERFGMEAIAAHEHALIEDCTRQLSSISGVRIIGHPLERAGVISFVIDGMKTEDVGKALSDDGIAVRSGHHCAQPILRRFGVEGSVRPSFALYNTHGDIDALIASVRKVKAGG